MRVPFWGINILGGWNVTYPFARLSIFADGVRVSRGKKIFFPFSFLVPTWEARHDELVEVAAVGKIDGITSGVLFRTAERGGWVVFWTVDRLSVLDALSAHGLPVDTTPRRFSYFRPYR